MYLLLKKYSKTFQINSDIHIYKSVCQILFLLLGVWSNWLLNSLQYFLCGILLTIQKSRISSFIQELTRVYIFIPYYPYRWRLEVFKLKLLWRNSVTKNLISLGFVPRMRSQMMRDWIRIASKSKARESSSVRSKNSLLLLITVRLG